MENQSPGNSYSENRNTAFDVEHQRYNELFDQFKLLLLAKNQAENELQFIKKAMLEKPVIATLTDEQCEKLGKAIGYYLADVVKSLVKDSKVPVTH